MKPSRIILVAGMLVPCRAAVAQSPATPVSLAAQARAAYSRSERAEAVALAERACEAREAAGCTLRGMLDEDWTKRVQFLQRGCDLGDGNSCFVLQTAYVSGLGLPKADVNRARKLSARSIALLDSACVAKDADACFAAGTLYSFDPKVAKYMGHTVPYDPARATERFGQALPIFRTRCREASASDCVAVATATLMGYGVPKDPARAVILFEASCDGGFAQACAQLGMMYSVGTEGITKDLKRAGDLVQRACDGGEPNACQLRQTVLSDANLAAMSVPALPKPRPFRVLRSLASVVGTFAAVRAIGGTDEEAASMAAMTVEMINPESEFAKSLGARGKEMLERSVATRTAELAAKAANASGAANAAGNVIGGASTGAGEAGEDTSGPPLVCSSAATKLRDGYHCMTTPDGSKQAPGKFAVPEIIGDWVERSAGVCVSYASGGNATARYKNGIGGGVSTKQGQWGIIARKSGAPESAPNNGWYLFTGALDAQTNLLVFTAGSARPFAGYDFKRQACPW